VSENDRRVFANERWQHIESLLEENGRVAVDELSLLFNVSRVTIRKDLDELERQGIVRRTYGGAIALAADINRADPTFKERNLLQPAEKSRIGALAASLINHGDTVVFDASTTALQVVKRIKDRHELTVVTNGLYIAMELEDAPGITVVMPGGVLRRGPLSLVGDPGYDALTRLNFQKGFFGSKGITIKEGLTDVNAFEVQTKRAMVASSQQVIAIVDHTKWGRIAFASFASLADVDIVITDTDAPPAMVNALRDRGIEVLLA
jgi:DeoR/GlpR family transcriptional regulator of sugar metabolism